MPFETRVRLFRELVDAMLKRGISVCESDAEGVTALHFATSFPNKLQFELSSCLVVGTSLGSIIVIIIQIPDHGDLRLAANKSRPTSYRCRV